MYFRSIAKRMEKGDVASMAKLGRILRWRLCICTAALACSGGAAATSDPTDTGPTMNPDAPGVLTMLVKRLQNSAVPTSADSAAIRVWHPSFNLNVVQYIAVPDPDSTTRVTFNLPSGTGYVVGILVIGLPRGAGRRLIAGGRRDSVSVLADTNVFLDVQVTPWQAELIAAPSTFKSATTDSVRILVTGGFPIKPDFGVFCGRFVFNLAPWTDDFDGVNNLLSSEPLNWVQADTFATVFTPPSVLADTTLWLQMFCTLQSAEWESFRAHGLWLFLPDQSLSDTLWHRPIVPGGGSITISFE